jgi:UDP-N-acetylmuramoyl-tripeptide--D-alanyl-D-alanine ligase
LGIAAAHRQKLTSCMWIGITGSVGKSTTKEMLAHILNAFDPPRKVHKAQGSFNNEIGLSKTILETPADSAVAVMELGTNHPGELERLAAVARPQIAVITGASESHLESFGSVENVAREKAAILKYQQAGDIAILNADDPFFELWKNAALGKIVSFGLAESADLSAQNLVVGADGCARFTLHCKASESAVTCVLSVPGKHQVYNALAAIAAAIAAGMSLKNAAAAAKTFSGVSRRFSIHRIKGISIIDDAYNANPASFRAALETLNSLPAARRFVIAGGMLELGAQCDAQHRELGAALATMALSGLTLVGQLAKKISQGAIENGIDPFGINFLNTPEEAARTLFLILRPGDALLIKGSHGIQLERCVEGLLAKLKA